VLRCLEQRNIYQQNENEYNIITHHTTTDLFNARKSIAREKLEKKTHAKNEYKDFTLNN
jgi:hypothetical protein